MDLSAAEAQLGMVLSDKHRQAMLDPADPIHEWCDFLVPDSPHELLRWVDVNKFLHAPDHWNPWPPFLVAFASNGCGDYFAYDLRTSPPRVIYLDPFNTVAEDLEADDKLEFSSFEEWYADRQAKHVNWPSTSTDISD